MAGIYKVEDLIKTGTAIFEAAGFRKDYAERVADNLVDVLSVNIKKAD